MANKRFNIVEELGAFPEGLKLYCTTIGKYCKVMKNPSISIWNATTYPIVVTFDESDPKYEEVVTAYGKLSRFFNDGETVIFPSAEHRTWDDWQEVLFKPGHYVTDGIIVGDVASVKPSGTTNAELQLRSYVPLDGNIGAGFPSPNIHAYRFAKEEEIEVFKKNSDKRIYVMPVDVYDDSSVECDVKGFKEATSNFDGTSYTYIVNKTNRYPKYYYLIYTTSTEKKITVCGRLVKEKVVGDNIMLSIDIKNKQLSSLTSKSVKKVLHVGYAICHDEDVYIERLGMRIATDRSYYRKIAELESYYMGEFNDDFIRDVLLSKAKFIEKKINNFIKENE